MFAVVPRTLGFLLCLHCVLAVEFIQRTCLYNSTTNRLKVFYSRYLRGAEFDNELPCRWKLTSMECGVGVKVAVWADSSWDQNDTPYLTAFAVNITTGGDSDTATTTQTNSLSTDSIAQFLANGSSDDTPWEWSCPDCTSPPDPYITGRFSRTSGVANILLGGLNITFDSVNKHLILFCGEQHFVTLEVYPEAYCDSNYFPESYTSVYSIISRPGELPYTDPHHYEFGEHYVSLVKQNVQQTKPLCQEAKQLMTSRAECPDIGNVMNECGSLIRKYSDFYAMRGLYEIYETYGYCMRQNSIDRFKVYVTCLRLLCEVSAASQTPAPSPTPASSPTPAAEDCDLLQAVADRCKGLRGRIHTNVTVLMSRAGCPVTVTTPAPVTTTVAPEALELGTACTENSECGNNARCKGTPTVCTCKSGYVSNDGKNCGRVEGKTCSRNAQCVANAYCKDGTCQCGRYFIVSESKFCVKQLGKPCSTDCDCLQKAACVEGKCRCRDGYLQPDDDNTQCKVAAGQVCGRTADCAANARCKGDPPRCTCLKGYISEEGRCGKPPGSNCTDASECVSNTRCGDYYQPNVCQCYRGYVQSEGFCYDSDLYCMYNSFQGNLRKFYKTITLSKSYYVAFPCRYKMADMQCSGARVVVTIDHRVEALNERALKARYSSGGVYISDVTINVTTTNDDGSVTSQINVLDVGKFQKYLRARDFTVSPWSWAYSGSDKPTGKERVKGEYNQNTARAEVRKGGLTVAYQDRDRLLYIYCRAKDFEGLADPYQTICGAPGDSDTAVLEELKARSNMDGHHDLARGKLDTYVALAKQDVQQTEPQCQEARDILTSDCGNIGESLYDCHIYYDPVHNFNPGRCLRVKGIDSFKLFLACMRVLCGQTGGDREESCAVFQTAQDACGGGGHLPLPRLMKIANCTATTTTTTTP